MEILFQFLLKSNIIRVPVVSMCVNHMLELTYCGIWFIYLNCCVCEWMQRLVIYFVEYGGFVW